MTVEPPPDAQDTRTRTGIKHESEPEDAADVTKRQRRVSELAQVKRTLAISRRETKAACRQIDSLRNDNSRLQLELLALARDEATARAFRYQDELTGLPNRRLLKDRLGQALARSARHDTQVVLLLLDLDDFKRINDSPGHAAGDHVLRMAAQRLSGGIRSADTACRYGGDEFVVMLPDVSSRTGTGPPPDEHPPRPQIGTRTVPSRIERPGGCSSMVEPQLPKPMTCVRLPSPAPHLNPGPAPAIPEPSLWRLHPPAARGQTTWIVPRA